MLNAVRHILRHPLNRNAPLSSMARFVRWQIATRLLPDSSVAVPFTDRARLLVSRGMYGATQNVYCGLNDFEDMSFLLHYLREGDVFLDVGANVGAYTVLASAAVGATTYAFEPSPSALDSLRANVEINRIADRVHIEPVAVGRCAGTIPLSTSGTSAMHHVGTDGNSSLVEMRAIDSYNLQPSVIKIDVEGYEAEVLAGAANTAIHPDLVAIITENNDDPNVSSFMREHNFTAAAYNPWQRSLTAKSARSDNTLYVRDRERIQSRLSAARAFRVFGRTI